MSENRPRRAPGPRCRALLEELSALLDNELSPARARALRRHLARCPCCADLQARLRRAVALCRKAGGPVVPAPVKRLARTRARALVAGRRR